MEADSSEPKLQSVPQNGGIHSSAYVYIKMAALFTKIGIGRERMTRFLRLKRQMEGLGEENRLVMLPTLLQQYGRHFHKKRCRERTDDPIFTIETSNGSVRGRE